MTGEVSWRDLPGHLAAAAALTVRAAPGTTVAYGTLQIGAGLLPVAAALLLRRLLDDLGGPAAGLTGPAVALAGVGVAVALVPLVGRHLRARLDRSVGLLAQDRLYRAMNRMAGIARMEDPAFRDRLRMAQQAGRSGPGRR